MSKEILTEKEAAEYISISQSFLRQDRMNGYRTGRTQGLKYMNLFKRSIRYSKEELNTWLARNQIIR